MSSRSEASQGRGSQAADAIDGSREKGGLIPEFLLALQFLSRVPIQVGGPVSSGLLARSMALYPLVGAALGAVVGGVYLVFLLVLHLPQTVSAALAIVVHLFLTGNLHLDGLMDAADGIYGGYTKERRLEIMRDSRVGAHGVAAAGAALLVRWSLLAALPAPSVVPLLITAMAVSRWSLVYGAYVYPYARPSGGLAKAYTDLVGVRELVVGALSAVVIGAVFTLTPWIGEGVGYPLVFAYMLLGAAIAVPLIAKYLAGKVGGITGDLLGALCEVVELLMLVIAVGFGG